MGDDTGNLIEHPATKARAEKAIAQAISIALKKFKPGTPEEMVARREMEERRRLYEETKAAVEAVADPGISALARVAALDTRVAKLEARLAELERK
jgi:hypothetical protein